MEYSTISLEKPEELAIDMCSNPPSSKLMNEEAVNPVSVVIDGVSMGWRKNISNAKEFSITPCYLFKVVVELENGNKTKRFLQIPRLSKYIP